ncbi:MAG: imidazole glycerol phosphate synthase subunit HisH [Pseudomonadota bacterium]
MTTAIIDYGSGNLRSAQKAFQRAARDIGLASDILVTSDPSMVSQADRVVLPGVGAFADCRSGLSAVDGMEDALIEAVIERGQPFFGICVGMQLMASRGLEKTVTEGFAWIPGDVVEIRPDDASLKIPHMGWNTIEVRGSHALLDGLHTGPDGLHAYFVHSYQLQATDEDQVLAETGYGGPVTAIVGRDTMIGTQFHPEKSQALGLGLIANFLAWKP